MPALATASAGTWTGKMDKWSVVRFAANYCACGRVLGHIVMQDPEGNEFCVVSVPVLTT